MALNPCLGFELFVSLASWEIASCCLVRSGPLLLRIAVLRSQHKCISGLYNYSLLFPIKIQTMMRRVYCMSVLACLVMLLTGVSIASAQSGDRRGEPNVLTSGYYVVDSDDDAPLPWRPNYFFVDTNYEYITWRRIASGPRQFTSALGHFFYNPLGWSNPNAMDTTDNAMAGPMPIGFSFNFYGIDYDSVYVSSNGFIGFRPYAEAVGTPIASPDNSYMARNAKDLTNANQMATAPPAIIAALWADLDMQRGDSSKVWVRTNLQQDTFMVNYYNFRLRPGSPNQGNFGQSGGDRIIIRKFQIVLARRDSSIQINYGPFSGALNAFPPTLAWRLFQNNVSIGTLNHTRTEATSVIFKNKWHAINTGNPNANKNFRQPGQWALKFKRWKNVVRAVRVEFPTRNFEICLGQATVVPKAVFRNVDTRPQSFKVRFSIRNVVTGIATYGRAVNAVNVTPQKDTTITFTNYATNPNILSQLGTFRACAIATTFDTNDFNIGDRWPFDDTSCVRVFGLRRIALPFNDASNGYSVTSIADIPDQHKWISIGAQVVDGEDATFDPPGPRDLDGGGYGSKQYKSPVIAIDRNDLEGNPYNGTGGDTVISFPINLQGQSRAGFTFDYHRGRRQTYPWLFDADVMFGPEHTVLNVLGGVIRRGDSMVVEFKKPTEPGCNPAPAGWNQITAIDGAKDFEFKKFFIRVENQNKPQLGLNYFDANFRFRLRLKAKYDGSAFPPPTDEEDPWFVDNLSLQVPRKPEIEVMWTRVVTPYTKLPASQAVSLPVYVKIANNSLDVAIAFPIRVQIVGPDGETKYWQTQTVTSIRGGTDSVIQMPNWNASNAGIGGGQEYVVHAWLAQEGYDSYEDDNGTYTKFFLNIEEGGGVTQEFAYDDARLQPDEGAGNDWPGVTLLAGQGIGFNGNNGSFATKFRLATKDTLYGVRVYFANANQAREDIRISLLEGNPQAAVPGDVVVQPGVVTQFEDVRRGDLFNKFWPYYFPKPIVLQGGADAANGGVYWLSVSQLSLDNMVMGADISRGGALIRVYDPLTPQIVNLYRSPYGTQADPDINNGDVSSAWALEVTAGDGSWASWMPTNGWWPTMAPAGNPLAWRTSINTGFMIWGGSYTPMIRPLVSRSILLPVEFAVPLKGIEQDGKALLTWTTANEQDNMGFFVERRPEADKEGLWEKVGFVGSKTTNSSTATGYAYVDANVTPGTYTYRLIQQDVNGAESVSNSVNVTIGAPSAYTVSQAYPNPFNPASGSTKFSISLPAAGPTSVVVFNAIGQVVRTIHNGDLEAGSSTFRWNGQDESGTPLSAGTYLVRVTSGSYTESMKITLTK